MIYGIACRLRERMAYSGRDHFFAAHAYPAMIVNILSGYYYPTLTLNSQLSGSLYLTEKTPPSAQTEFLK